LIPYGSGVTGDQTIAAWVRTTSDGHIVNPYQGGKYNLRLQYDNPETLRAVRFDGDSVAGDVQVDVDVSSLTHVAAQYDASDDVVRLFADGNQIGSDPNSTDITTLADYYIASQDEKKKFFDGVLDEIRFSSVVRSEAWITTSQTNQSDPLSFYAVGPEQPLRSAKPARTGRTATTTVLSDRIGQRATVTNAVANTQLPATANRTAVGSVNGVTTTDVPTTLPIPSVGAITPTALTTEAATTTAEQARASATTAKSTAIETKPRVFKFADAQAVAAVQLKDVSTDPTRSGRVSPTTTTRVTLRPTATSDNRRSVDDSVVLNPQFRDRSDTVQFREQNDDIEYDT